MSTLPVSLPPLNSDRTLAIRVAIDEAGELIWMLGQFRDEQNDALAVRLQRAITASDFDELTEGIYFARKALNLSCCVCGEEMDVEPSRELQCCSLACYGGD